MKLLAPEYYKDFVCIADRCKHSCCIGWEIDVDKNSIDKYHSLKSPYSDEIIKSIEFDETPHFILDYANRCPHLDSDGFCQIIKNVGEDFLCDICREHPRFYNFTDCGQEVGIGLSCEEACRIILSRDDFDELIPIGEVDGEPKKTDYETFENRERVFKIIKDEDMCFGGKVEYLMDYFDLYFEEEPIVDILSSLEYLDENHKALFSKFTLKSPSDEILNKVLRAWAYFVYRHCAEAETYDDFFASLSFTIVCAYLISSISDENNIEEMARIVSEEIEYSTSNVDLIKSLFY